MQRDEDAIFHGVLVHICVCVLLFHWCCVMSPIYSVIRADAYAVFLSPKSSRKWSKLDYYCDSMAGAAAGTGGKSQDRVGRLLPQLYHFSSLASGSTACVGKQPWRSLFLGPVPMVMKKHLWVTHPRSSKPWMGLRFSSTSYFEIHGEAKFCWMAHTSI